MDTVLQPHDSTLGVSGEIAIHDQPVEAQVIIDLLNTIVPEALRALYVVKPGDVWPEVNLFEEDGAVTWAVKVGDLALQGRVHKAYVNQEAAAIMLRRGVVFQMLMQLVGAEPEAIQLLIDAQQNLKKAHPVLALLYDRCMRLSIDWNENDQPYLVNDPVNVARREVHNMELSLVKLLTNQKEQFGGVKPVKGSRKRHR